MSSSGYSNSSEVKARMSEVLRFPGIGFSSCTVPTFSCIQGILNGGYELSFWNALEQRMHTGIIPSTSTKMREVEVQSFYSSEVCRMCKIELACRKSQVERDKYELSLSSIFRM